MTHDYRDTYRYFDEVGKLGSDYVSLVWGVHESILSRFTLDLKGGRP